jgi:hypothetical protein
MNEPAWQTLPASDGDAGSVRHELSGHQDQLTLQRSFADS